MPATPPPRIKTRRLTVRLDEVTHERASFWSGRSEGLDSLNEYVVEAVMEKIERDSGLQVDSPDLLINRINQLIDGNRSLETAVTNLSTVSTTGFDLLLRIARGDSFLIDDESGELRER